MLLYLHNLLQFSLTTPTGAHQRFFRSLCISLKVPRAIEICKKALSQGQCVVIGLQTTGQAADDALYTDKENHNSGSSYGAEVQRELAELRNSSWNSTGSSGGGGGGGMKMDWLPPAGTEGVSSI